MSDRITPPRARAVKILLLAVVGSAVVVAAVSACGSAPSAGSSASVGGQAVLMETINQDRTELLAGTLTYSQLAPVKVGSTEMLEAWLRADSSQHEQVPLGQIQTKYELRVGGVEGATLSAPGGGVAITPVGPTTGLIGKPGDKVEWSWSLKSAQPGTHPLDLVVVTYQGETSNPLYTLKPPLVINLVVTDTLAHRAGAVGSAAGKLAAVVGTIAGACVAVGGCATGIRKIYKKRRNKKKLLRDKKAEAYADALGATSARAKWLSELMAAARKVNDGGGIALLQKLPEHLPSQSEQQWENLHSRLQAYGTPEVLRAYRLAYEMAHVAGASYRSWREAVTDSPPLLTRPLKEPGAAEQRNQAVSGAWRELIGAFGGSRDADAALNAAVRLDLKVDLPTPSGPSTLTGWLNNSGSSAQSALPPEGQETPTGTRPG